MALVTQAEAAHSDMKSSAGEKTMCSDPQEPASLRCAPAPSSQFDSNGILWVAWSYGGHVYVSTSDDKGQTFKPAMLVNQVPEKISARGENRPKIVVDKQGHIYVSWTTPLKKRYTGNIRFSVSNDQGQNFSKPITINDNLDMTGHRFEALAVNDQGVIFMAWLDKRERLKAKQQGKKYNGAALYYSYSKDGGKSFSKNQSIMSHSCECCRVVMAIDKDQLPVVMWRNIYGKNTRDHALVKFLSQDKAGKVVQVSHDNWQLDACPHHGPAISIETNGIVSNYHLVWFNNAPQRHGLFYSRMSDPNKTAQSSPKEPISIGNYDKGASHPDVLSIANKVWLVWREYDGENESIWLQVSNDQGDSWQQSKIIAQTQSGSDYPFLIHDQGTVYLQWQTKEQGFKLYAL
ncbi:sialidase family protein [sulfur-oxidizing endosymbiont of Gigantopelta aegis]|uniref:sialidase family protein n=1 Tax=sulfur-oxidizing endosymbiont of Gigantopelta aegis TaxID=2794934 RepID=UPI001BE4268C|nr:sialidase family protein [sulfur-oxidizing endosymbiont of Gigantopelta aegis]